MFEYDLELTLEQALNRSIERNVPSSRPPCTSISVEKHPLTISVETDYSFEPTYPRKKYFLEIDCETGPGRPNLLLCLSKCLEN